MITIESPKQKENNVENKESVLESDKVFGDFYTDLIDFYSGDESKNSSILENIKLIKDKKTKIKMISLAGSIALYKKKLEKR